MQTTMRNAFLAGLLLAMQANAVPISSSSKRAHFGYRPAAGTVPTDGGSITSKGADAHSGGIVWRVDFLGFSVVGTYRIHSPALGEQSYGITIGGGLYAPVARKAQDSPLSFDTLAALMSVPTARTTAAVVTKMREALADGVDTLMYHARQESYGNGMQSYFAVLLMAANLGTTNWWISPQDCCKRAEEFLQYFYPTAPPAAVARNDKGSLHVRSL